MIKTGEGDGGDQDKVEIFEITKVNLTSDFNNSNRLFGTRDVWRSQSSRKLNVTGNKYNDIRLIKLRGVGIKYTILYWGVALPYSSTRETLY